MPFEVIIDSAEIIMGRNIRNTPESIASATAELDRKVTLMADIFDVGDPEILKAVRRFILISLQIIQVQYK